MRLKYIIIFLSGVILGGITLTTAFAASSLAQRLAGRILLQVEEKGEAWYVDPVDLTRHYLGRPRDCFNLMREKGLGITNANLAEIPVMNSSLQESIIYNNDTYKFELSLPKSWSGYQAKNRILNWGYFGSSDSIDFGFTEQDSIFNISIHTKKQWQEIISEEGPKPTYLRENSWYVFAYSLSQYAANDTMVARRAEVKSIIETFKFK